MTVARRRIYVLASLLGLAACAHEPPPPSPVHDGPADLSAVRAQLQTQLPTLERMACLSAAAYVGESQPQLCLQYEAGPGITLQSFPVSLQDVFGRPYTGYYTFLIDNARQEQIIAIRGTDNIEDWYTDLHFIPVIDDILDVYVHQGFQLYARAVLRQLSASAPVYGSKAAKIPLNPNYRTYLTGHSLGGGVAVLLGLYLHVNNSLPIAGVYTFGQPRVFDNHGATSWPQFAQTIYHVENCDDPVPLVPIGENLVHWLIVNPLSGAESRQYEHLGHEILLLNAGKYWIPANNEIVRNPVIEVDEVVHEAQERQPTPHDIAEYIAKLDYLRTTNGAGPTNPAYQFQCGIFVTEPPKTLPTPAT
jgi:Lipase (class 3)